MCGLAGGREVGGGGGMTWREGGHVVVADPLFESGRVQRAWGRVMRHSSGARAAAAGTPLNVRASGACRCWSRSRDPGPRSRARSRPGPAPAPSRSRARQERMELSVPGQRPGPVFRARAPYRAAFACTDPAPQPVACRFGGPPLRPRIQEVAQ